MLLMLLPRENAFPHSPTFCNAYVCESGWSSSLFCVCESLESTNDWGRINHWPAVDPTADWLLVFYCPVSYQSWAWNVESAVKPGGLDIATPRSWLTPHKTPPVPSAMQKLTWMNLEHVTMHCICTVLVYTTAIFTCIHFH